MAKGKKNGNGKHNQKELVAVAEEMNEVMGLEPAIDTELVNKELIKEIKDNAVEIEPDDVFSEETQNVLMELGIVIVYDESPEKEVEDKEEPEEEEETEEIIEEDVKEKKTAKIEKDVKKKPAKGKGKSRYGHQDGSAGALIDDLVWEGTSLKSVVNAILKKFPDRDERATTNKVNAHIRDLSKAGIKIDTDDKKQMKAQQESI